MAQFYEYYVYFKQVSILFIKFGLISLNLSLHRVLLAPAYCFRSYLHIICTIQTQLEQFGGGVASGSPEANQNTAY